MSDPHQTTPSSVNSLLETLLGDDEQQYESSTLDIMVEKGTRWLEWDVDFTPSTDKEAETPSDSGGGGNRRGWEQPPVRKKRCCSKQTHGYGNDVEDPQSLTCPGRERQRGKNWEKAEEDILVDCKSQEMDWKSISEYLQEHGYTRNHKHCADKWYALRKHYLEIHQWRADNPTTDYWDRSEGERIRSVPPSFCQKWYLVFDAVENKEGRKKGNRLKSEGPSPTRSDPSPPSCLQSVLPCGPCGDEGFPKVELEPLFSNRATALHHPTFNIQVLVTEIYNLTRALTVKFAAEEEERSRNLAIKEKKLELKIQRFEYKRKRDEEKQKSVAQCLNFAVKAYD